jgi:hypothetical protein
VTTFIAASASSGWTAAAIATIVAAVVSAIVSLGTSWAAGVRKEQERRRSLYADAFAALVVYREFAYVIRRRRAPIPGREEIAGEERVRISEALRIAQKELAYFTAWIRSEAGGHLADCYEALVAETRRVAGGYMREAWNAAPLAEDSGMNISDIDFRPLSKLEEAYLDAVQTALSFWRVAMPWWKPAL